MTLFKIKYNLLYTELCTLKHDRELDFVIDSPNLYVEWKDCAKKYNPKIYK